MDMVKHTQTIWPSLFHLKIRELSGDFDLMSGKAGKINTFLEKYIFSDKFSAGVIFSYAHCYVLKCFPTFSYYISIMLQPGYLCSKI